MTRMVRGYNPLSYQGVNASSPPNMIILQRAPLSSDSKNVSIGDFWLDDETQVLYQLVSLANDTAVWIEIATSTPGAAFFNADVGTATAVAQTVTMHGGSNINTTAAGSTVTYNLNNTIVVTGNITGAIIEATNSFSLTSINVGYTNTQWISHQYAVQTTNATPTTLFTLPLVNSQMIQFNAYINGFRADFAQSVVAQVFTGAYRPAAGNVALNGIPVVSILPTSTENVSVTTTAGSVIMNVIGVAGQTYNWVGTVYYMYLVSNA